MFPIPITMVPPSQPRKGIWRHGIIQIHVTRACDLSCHSCSQGSNLAGRPVMMTPDQFAQACDSLADFWGVVGVFGGNPAVHPEFGKLCEIMRGRIAFEQRGLWCNRLMGKGAHAKITFNVAHSNLNVHLNTDAYEEFLRDWPESAPYLKGRTVDSVHGSPWVAMKDVIADEATRWDLIGKCDVNQFWSAMICVVRGELRGFFCEIAGAMAMLHEGNPDWDGTGASMGDIGVPIEKGWWRRPMSDFETQVRTCCPNCGIPMRRPGVAAIHGDHEEFSPTHASIARPKVKGRPVEIVTIGDMMTRSDRPATDYLPGTTPRARA